MQENKSLFWKNAMNFGAIVGLALIVYSVILFVIGKNESQVAGILNYVILIAGIYLGTKQYRDNFNNGILSYQNGLGTGTVIAFFASIILALYLYIFLQFIDPESIERMKVIAEEKLMDRGLTDDQIEMQMRISEKFMTPALTSLMTIPAFTFFGFLFSLITSAILKKEGDPFKADMQEIENQEE